MSTDDSLWALNWHQLWSLVLSSIFFFEPKIAFSIYVWIWRDLVTNVLYDGQCRAWRSHFLNIAGCCNFTEMKSREVCTVLLDMGLFLYNWTTLAKNHSVWPSSTLKTVHREYCLSLSVAQLVRFWFKSLQSLTAHERQFSICAPSFVTVVWCKWALCVFVVRAENTPQIVSCNLKLIRY